MMRRLLVVLGSYFFGLTILNSQGLQQEVQLQYTTAPYGFVEYLPEGYEASEQLYPLIVFLHGLGESGNGNDQLHEVKNHGPNKLINEGKSFDAVILSPQSVSWWDIAKIDQFVEWAFNNYKLDRDYFYMTGLSMGGGGTWLYARDYPEKLAAIVPICGAADVSHPENLLNIPVWAFHNDGDPVVQVKQTYDWIKGIRNAGGSPLLTIYHSDAHDAWTATYNNDEVWEWMFSFKLGDYNPLLKTTNPETIETWVYPNPVSDHLIIDSNINSINTIYLSDMNGKLIESWTDFNFQDNKIHLDLEPLKLNAGIYLLHVGSHEGNSTIRLRKE